MTLFPAATEETKRKMYSSVLLIGGGFMFNGAQSALQSRLQAKLPASHRKLVDQVDVIARPKVSFPPPVEYLPALTYVWLKEMLPPIDEIKTTYGKRFLKESLRGDDKFGKISKEYLKTQEYVTSAFSSLSIFTIRETWRHSHGAIYIVCICPLSIPY